MRSTGYENGCLKWRVPQGGTKKRINAEFADGSESAEKKHRNQTSRTSTRKKKELEEAENDFNVDAAIHGFAAGAYGATPLPDSHAPHGLFFQADSPPRYNPPVETRPVRRDEHAEPPAA